VPTGLPYQYPQTLLAQTELADGFKTDISAIPDLAFKPMTRLENLEEALLRRLTTPRGGLFYDPEYGLDVREYLNAALSDAEKFELETFIALECEKDERVNSAISTITQPSPVSLIVEVLIETTDADVTLVMGVHQNTVEVLRASVE
jgi:phage baseplate assembly protein W